MGLLRQCPKSNEFITISYTSSSPSSSLSSSGSEDAFGSSSEGSEGSEASLVSIVYYVENFYILFLQFFFLNFSSSYCSQWELPALASRLSTYTTLPSQTRLRKSDMLCLN